MFSFVYFSLMPERKSFRAYTSVLYVDPRMKIYINSKKVTMNMFILTNDQYQTQAVHHQRSDLHLKYVTYCH